MLDQYDFHVNTRLNYGVGCSKNLDNFLNEKGFSNVVILVDEGVLKHSPYFDRIKKIIEESTEKLSIEILRGSEEPDYDYLDEITERVRAIDKVDVLIGIGGGSCMDIAKAVAVLKTNPGKGIEYRGFDKVERAGIPSIAIPTTAGTGSEVTINAVFTNKNEMKKLGINGRYINFTYALLDAEWTMSCPKSVAVSSGMDALTHAMESFMCKKANPLTRMFSKEAFRLLFNALPSLVDEPENREKRQQILLGSYIAGIALYNSGSGIAGALSYPIGVHYKVPHGIGGGIFLVSVIEYNVSKGYNDYAELLDEVEFCANISKREKSMIFSERMRCLVDKLGVPRYLDGWGITSNNVNEVAKLMLPLQAAFDQNPILFLAEKDAVDILKKHVMP